MVSHQSLVISELDHCENPQAPTFSHISLSQRLCGHHETCLASISPKDSDLVQFGGSAQSLDHQFGVLMHDDVQRRPLRCHQQLVGNLPCWEKRLHEPRPWCQSMRPSGSFLMVKEFRFFQRAEIADVAQWAICSASSTSQSG